MEQNQLIKAIPIYNDIQSLTVTINHLKQIKVPDVSLTKCYLTLSDGNQIDLNNFDKDFSKFLLSSLLVYKENQLKLLTDKLKAI